MWLTTADVARMLEVTPRWVRGLARDGMLRFEPTRSGQRLFYQPDVLGLVERRAKARIGPAVTAGRHVIADLEPRQLSLFGKAKLQLVDVGGERALPHAEAKAARSFKELARV